MATSRNLTELLAATADAAAARWDRWGPSAEVGYPLPQWRLDQHQSHEQLGERCATWMRRAGVGTDEVTQTSRRLATLEKAGVRTITILDQDFPPQLRAIENPPLVLHAVGKLSALQTGVAMVGSREPELPDLEEVGKLATWLGVNGLTVITGMARGVDKASALVAVRNGGVVLGVVPGSPLEEIPKEAHDAYVAVRKQGCLISEVTGLPRQSQGAIRASFLRRNRIISGMSRIVVAFRPRSSGGTFNQLEWSARQGRPVIVVGPEGRYEFAKAARSHFEFTESGGDRLVPDAGRYWTRRPESAQATLA